MAESPFSHPYYSTIPTTSHSPFYPSSIPSSPNPYTTSYNPYDYRCFCYYNFYQQPSNNPTPLSHHVDFPNSQSTVTTSLTCYNPNIYHDPIHTITASTPPTPNWEPKNFTNITNHSQPVAAPNTNTTPKLPIRRITTAQSDERKAQRLCFFCDDKFVPGQRCKTPRFLLLIVDEEKQEVQKAKEEPEKQRAEEVEPLKQASQQLSPSPVNTPSREFESGKNGYDYFPAPPPKLPSSLLQEPSFTFSVPQPPPPLPDLKSSPITSFSQTMTLPPPLKPSEKALTPLLSSLRQPTEPPDLHWPSEIFPPPPPSLLRPPAKPPDQHSQAEYFLTLALPPPPKPPDRNFLRSTAKSSVKIISWYFRTVRSILHHDYQNNFAPSDQFSAFRAESRPLKENTIRVMLYCPIMRRNVALLVSYHSKQLSCQLSSIQHIPPTSNRHVSQFDLLTTFLLLRHVTCDSTRHQVQLSQQKNIMGLQICAKSNGPIYLCWDHGPKSDRPKISIRCNFVVLFGTRPARKPPDLYLNLEDKVKVNPAAMIED